MGTKRCPGCLQLLSAEMFSGDKSKPGGLRRLCKGCDNVRRAAWRQLNPEKYAVQQARRATLPPWSNWSSDDRRQYEAANRDVVLALKRRRNQRAKENLTDGFIRAQLIAAGFMAEQITQELLQLKRAQISTRRLSRQLKKAIDESSQNTR